MGEQYGERMGRLTTRRPVLRLSPDGEVTRPDTLVVEEPLELRVEGVSLTVTMRTPGDDLDLAAGFLVAEGAVTRQEQIRAMRYCAGADATGQNSYNILDLTLTVPAPPPRAFATTSSCGVCGTASLDLVRQRATFDLSPDMLSVNRLMLSALPPALRAGQAVFDRTGGLHAAGLFSPDGTLLCLREDVGRHNAVDKVVGWALREDRLPLSGTVLLVSGRASFELVQKAWQAGIPVLASVSAPSSLAVDLASEAGMTLIGFLRGDTMNVYSGAHRVVT
jgi:FdhD protein